MGSMMMACGVAPTINLDDGLIAHYLLNNNADDCHGTYDGTIVGTVDFTGDYLNPLSGSVTIPSTGGTWCSYWIDTGSGMIFTTSATVPSSLDTNKYSNLRIYSSIKTGTFLTALEEEGYYPKPLPLPTTDGLIAHYPLTGTAEDTTGNYNGTEISVDYIDDTEFGSCFSLVGNTDTDRSIQLPTINNISTISFWVKRTGTKTYVISRLLEIQTNRFTIADETDTSSTISVYITDQWYYFTSSLITNKSTHLVFVQNGANIDLYIDGSYSDSVTATIPTFSTGMVIGNNYASNNPGFVGVIRDMRLYSDSLTQQEITDIYNYEKNFRPIDIDDGLVAYYPLASNSNDNYYNEYDGVDTDVTYDGLSASFNGTSSGITSDYTANIEEKISVTCWIKSTDINKFVRIFHLYNSTLPQQSFQFYTVNDGSGRLKFNAYGEVIVASPPIGNVLDGNWHHCGFVVDTIDDTVEFYVDGDSVGVESITGVSSKSIEHAAIGFIDRTNDDIYEGIKNLAHIRYYNKLLNQEQVKVIYNSEKGDFE